MSFRKHILIETEWPEFGDCPRPQQPPAGEFQKRIEDTILAMDKMGLTHLIVYGDREHFAKLAWLTGFDPRYEEAILVISMKQKPLLIVGNECEGYLSVSPLFRAGEIRTERFQPLSLLNQPRDNSRFLKEILSDEGISGASRVGCAGWKYFSDSEHPDGERTLELPSYMADTLRELAGREHVINASGIFMNPDTGLRTFCTPSEIAYFEYTNILASEGMRRIMFGIKEGKTDHELATLAGFNGEPLATHMTFVTKENLEQALSGPVGAVVHRGSPLAVNLSYWGSNICRAGWVASSAKDLSLNAQDYVENFAGIYFEVMSQWFKHLKIGTPGDMFWHLIQDNLPFDKFGIFLNPGHLIHLDEWLSSPFFRGSELKIHSGMAIQVDVIPSSSVYFSTRMEDGVVIADRDLQDRLGKEFPDCYSRCIRRREFMRNVLGIEVPEEVLPLSNIPAIVPPFFLEPQKIFALER